MEEMTEDEKKIVKGIFLLAFVSLVVQGLIAVGFFTVLFFIAKWIFVG